MFFTRKITDSVTWVGANNRKTSMFEAVYPISHGMAYNSYLINDEKTVLFDTVDISVSQRFFENVAHTLNGRGLDYVVVQHLEPDHSATLSELLYRHPETKIVCSDKALGMIKAFYGEISPERVMTVREGDTLDVGYHKLRFFTAPMVHWPEVIVTFDETEGILFSADAFGAFGALDGAVFADEVDFERDYLDEARRYYANIVGKYSLPVQTLLGKTDKIEVKIICPLHGFIWRNNLSFIIDKYRLWSSYTPEEEGVMIAYASVYGNTENAAEILAGILIEAGVKTVMYDVSVTHSSDIVAAAFRFGRLVFASTTYNGAAFICMDELLRDLAAHNIQNRTVAFIENGSWAPSAGKHMAEILAPCKNMTFTEKTVNIRSSLKEDQIKDIEELAHAISGK